MRSRRGTRRRNHRWALVLLGGALGCGGSDTPMGTDEPDIRFVSTPVLSVDHNRPYAYTVQATAPGGAPVSFTAAVPSWMTFAPGQGSITGRAGWENAERLFPVTVTATSGTATARQQFNVTVNRGEIMCEEGFGVVGESPYVLPYAVGEAVTISQGNCNPNGGHNLTFAYDFLMSIGDTVRAARAGTVIVVTESFVDGDPVSGHENNVFIEHADGTAVRYTHLTQDGALVEVGDSVMQGQPIGISGNTGATGGLPHLHFAVYRAAGNYTRKFSLPVNFRNVDGDVSPQGALLGDRSYGALPFEPDAR